MERDHDIRTWLRNSGYDVIEIVVSDLDDEGAMVQHFRRLAGYLRADELRESVRADKSWFARSAGEDNVDQEGRESQQS